MGCASSSVNVEPIWSVFKELKIFSHTASPNLSGFVTIPLVEHSTPYMVGNLHLDQKKKKKKKFKFM